MDAVISYRPNIAVIASPSPFHLEMCENFLNMDTHLLIEKPIADSTEGVCSLLTRFQQKELILMVGYNLRYSPSLDFFRNLIKGNAIGEIHSVRCEVGQYLPTWRPDTDYRQGVSARKELGGGVLLELSHEIDYLRWIFGEMEWVRASISKQSNLEIDVEDTAHMTIGFSSQRVNRQLIAALSLDFIRHDHTRTCVAIGESGSLRWNGLTGSIDQIRPGEKEWNQIFLHKADPVETYISEWENFVETIGGLKPPLVTGLDGLRALEVIEAAWRSAPTGNQTMIERSNLENGNNL